MTKFAKVELIEELKIMLPAGTKVYTILRHVSRSGMRRRISVLTWDKNLKDLQDISYSVAQAIGRRIATDNEGIVCNGCGMDMGFELIYALSQAVYGDGYALKSRWL